MAERYSRIFELPQHRYAAGSPVVLEAGALLKDNKTGGVLAQLKFRSVCPKTIKLLTVELQPLDSVGRELGEPVPYQYLDLDARRNSDFGSKQAIPLPNGAARSFRVRVMETGYADNTVSGEVSSEWAPLSAPVEIGKVLNDAELTKQYHMRHGQECRYEAQRVSDLWYCSCGALNRQEEESCHKCGRAFLSLAEIDLDTLKAEKEQRLAEEHRMQEEAAQLRRQREAEAEQQRRQREAENKKKAKIFAITAAVSAVIVAAVLMVTKVVIPNSNYNKAVALMEAEQYEEAIAAFTELTGYKDSEAQIANCKEQIIDLEYQRNYNEAAALMEAGKYEEAITAFTKLAGYKDSEEQIAACKEQSTEQKYLTCLQLMDAGEYEDAIDGFAKLGNYKDSNAQLMECKYQSYLLLKNTKPLTTAIAFAKMGYKDSAEQSLQLWAQFGSHSVIDTYNHTVGLKPDGTVIAVGDNRRGECNVSKWTNIVSVSAGYFNTIGLKSDGTVIAVGYNPFGQCNVSDWKDIVAVSAGADHTVGLRSDGTVIAVGENDYGQCDVSYWKDIVAVSAGGFHTVGLKSDGTVIAVGKNKYGQCDVSNWKDIVAVSAAGEHTVGLKSDGTVIAVGYNDGRCDVSEWKDIVAVSAGSGYTVGLKSDGTVVAVGYKNDVSNWKDIVAVSADSNTVGLKSDGTVIAVGYNFYGQCDVSGWTNIKQP